MSEAVVPDGWKCYEIKDVALASDRYSFTGGPFGSNLKSEDYTESGVRIIQLQNIGEGQFKNTYKIYTTEAKADELRSCNIYPNDIILSKMGDPVARATIIPSFDKRYLMASDGIRLAVDDAQFDTKYIHDTINSVPFRTQAEINSTGSTRKRIGLTELRKLIFIAPPLPEQQKIAAILTSVDNVIESTEAQINKLQDLKTGMMQELLTKGIGHSEFKDSPVGRIPVGWEVSKLSNLVNSTRPVTYGIVQTGNHVTNGIPCIRVVDLMKPNIPVSEMIRTSEEISAQYKRTILQPRDIMFALRGEIGHVRMVTDNLVGANLTRGVALVSPKFDINERFLLWAIRSDNVRKNILDGVNGSALQEIPLGNLRDVDIPVPSFKEQKAIADTLDSIAILISKQTKRLDSDNKFKKALMQDLLTGKVRVKVNQ